jgi:hypothetical protein
MHGEPSWGFGDLPKSIEEFHARFAGLSASQLENPGIYGCCSTQLTDVFQEQNGVYYFDRSAKFDPARLRAAQAGPAAVEPSWDYGDRLPRDALQSGRFG